MSERDNKRLVYSTDTGRVCRDCGQPVRSCRCRAPTSDQPLPARIVAKLRVEKTGRSGKTVTVVFGLPDNAAFLRELSQDLKRACGTGGAVVEGEIELQGDLRERVRAYLAGRGFAVKG